MCILFYIVVLLLPCWKKGDVIVCYATQMYWRMRIHASLPACLFENKCLLRCPSESQQEHHVGWKNLDDSDPEPLKKHDKEVKKVSSLATSVIKKEQMSNLVQ